MMQRCGDNAARLVGLLALALCARCAAGEIGVTLEANRREVCVQQQLVVTMTVSSPEHYYMEGLPIDVPMPDSFIRRKTGRGVELGIVKGERGRVERRSYQRVVFPTKPGRYKIGPAEILLSPALENLEKQRKVASAPLEIEVKPLPAGAPTGFKGLVGDARVEVRLSTRSVSPGGTIRVVVVVRSDCLPTLDMDDQLVFSGLGAFAQVGKTISARASEFVDGCLLSTWTLARRYRPISGAGEADLAVSVVRFDPVASRYRTETVGPFRIACAAGTETASPSAPAPASPDDALKTLPRKDRVHSLRWPLLPLGGLLVIILGVMLVLRRQRRGRAMPDSVRAHLRTAAGHAGEARPEEFVTAVRKAVREALYVRFAIGPYGPAETVVRELEKHGASAELVGRVREMLRRCAEMQAGGAPVDARAKAAMLKEAERLAAAIMESA